jgi:uncharacterized protein DUF4347/Big-like domain-containing protein/low-density lipoprotein receptor class B
MGNLLALEPRIMFDGAALVTGAEVLQDAAAQDQTVISGIDGEANTDSNTNDSSARNALWSSGLSLSAPSDSKEIVFIDTRVEDYQTLMEGIDLNAEVILLDSTRDGVEQIAEILSERSDIDAIHLIAEGNEAELHLGTSFLTQEAISGRYANLFTQIGQSLSAEADLLIYGCNFGRGEAGQDAMATLAELTGADIAASTDRSGHSTEYADWELEAATGTIETAIVIGEATQTAWEGVLAIYTVTTTTDGGLGSLRQAIIDANANAGTDTITFTGSGTYLLTIGGTAENAAATGDLDITDDLIIIGNGAKNTIIDGGGLDRVFDVRSGADVTISGITIQGGNASGDGGGGIYHTNSGTLTLRDTSISGNTARWGGGLYNEGGSVVLERVTIGVGNSASSNGGGIYNFGAGSSMSLINLTITGNSAGSNGGGIWTNRSIDIINSTIAFNTSGGGIYGSGAQGTATLQNTILDSNIGGNANKALTSLGNNIDSDSTAGLGDPLDGVDPMLAGLADNGGPTQTHALLAGSPAINAGTNLNAPAVDQRGFQRVDGSTDIGAVESGAVVLNKIYWVDQTNDTIQRANLDGSNIETVLTSANGVNSPTEILIDAVGGKMYWSEYFSGNIKRANLDGSNIETLYSGLSSPAGMAFDIANNMLYWTENPLFGGTNQIRRADMDGGGSIDNLVTTGTNDPVDLQLDLEAGKIYWTDGNTGEIRRADLDGSNVGVFLSGLTKPQGLVLDRGARMVYWASDGFGTNKIQRANLDGAPVVQDLVATGLTSPIGIELDLSAGKIYWSDWGTNKIQQANLDGTNVTDIVTTGLNLPIGIAMGASVTNVVPTLDLDANNSSGATGNDYTFIFTEGDAPTAIADNDTDLVDPDSTTFTYVQLAVSGLLDGNSETLILDDDTFGLATAVAGQDTGGGNYHLVVSTGAGTATVTITKTGGGNFTEAETETLIKAVQYQHTNSSTPTDGNRLIDIVVNDGTADSAAARTTINVNPVNDQPAFSGLDNSPTFTAGGAAVVLDSNATIADPELDAINNYNGATLTLVRNGGANADDLFDGSGTLNTLTESGSLIVGGTTIGTVTTNSGGNLVLTFNGNATTARVNSALQQITYANSNGTPPASVQIDFNFNDGNVGAQGSGGALNATGAITVSITSVNIVPTLDLDANDSSGASGNDYTFTFSEGDAPTAIADSDTDLVDADSVTFAYVKLAISGLLDGNNETLVLDGDTFGLATTVAGQDTGGGNYHVVIGTGAGTATVTLTKQGGGTFTEVETETLIKAIQYQHTDTSTPTDGNRLIDIIVNDGSADSAAARSTINVNPVNDQPAFTGLDNTPTFTEGSSPVMLDSNATIADAELDAANDYNGATLTLVRNGGANAEDLFGGSGTLNALTESGSLVVGGTTIGTVTTNSGGTLVLTFNANATTARVNSTLQQLTYANSNSTPPSNVQIDFTINDGNAGAQGSGGALNDTGSITVTITATNTAPTFTGLDNTPTFLEGGTAVVLDGNATIADPELDAANNYNGATLTLTRNGGANAEDLFGGSGTLLPLVESGPLVVGGTTIGTVTTNSGGTLVLSFNGNATTALVNSALQQLTYANSSNTPPTNVQIDYTINDGNAGAQGSGGALNGTGSITVSITSVNTPPVAVADGFTVNEGSTTILNLAGNDVDLDDGLDLTSITIVSGPTNGTIDSINVNGTVDYTHNGSETLADSFTYTIDDLAGATSNTVTVSLTVTPQNDAPIITSNGGGASATVTVIEGNTAVTDVNAFDAEGGPLTYSLIGGADAALFNIDPITGVLTFNMAPDSEAPGDVGGDNVYNVVVQVSDGTTADTQTIAVTVTKAPPAFIPPPPPDPTPDPTPPPTDGEGDDGESEDETSEGGVPVAASSPGNVPGAGQGSTAEDSRNSDTGNNFGANNLSNMGQQTDHTSDLGNALDEILELLRKPFEPTAIKGEIQAILTRWGFLEDLDRVRDAFQDVTATEQTYLASSVAASTGLSIGYVFWLLRSGVLLTALLSSLPAWQFVNPLLVLDRPEKKKRKNGQEDPEDDSVESMFENDSVSAETSKTKTNLKTKEHESRWSRRT